jgi:hypothetical protein
VDVRGGAIRQRFEEQPDTSTRSFAHTLSVKHMLVWQVLHDEHLHPYHLQKVQGMGPNDFAPHVKYLSMVAWTKCTGTSLPMLYLIS